RLRAVLETRRVAEVGGPDAEPGLVLQLGCRRSVAVSPLPVTGGAPGALVGLAPAGNRGGIEHRRLRKRNRRRVRPRESGVEPLDGRDRQPPLGRGEAAEGGHVARDAALERAQEVLVGRRLAARRRAQLEAPAREIARARRQVLVDRERGRAVAAPVLTVTPGAGVVVDGGGF